MPKIETDLDVVRFNVAITGLVLGWIEKGYDFDQIEDFMHDQVSEGVSMYAHELQK